jgi:hypothetical protein
VHIFMAVVKGGFSKPSYLSNLPIPNMPLYHIYKGLSNTPIWADYTIIRNVCQI